MAWLHQWDIVAGIPSPPERGYGQLNCGELGYNFVVHKGGSRPMCVDALNCTCTECVQSFLTKDPAMWARANLHSDKSLHQLVLELEFSENIKNMGAKSEVTDLI